MLSSSSPSPPPPPPPPLPHLGSGTDISTKKKRRPAGTPDPDAEVVSLSPRTLLESDRYVCEICNQGFQRDQNLQMHRRRHKVPWKLLKREPSDARKRVFVCPEPSCLHHDPCHALGDLVGIKKHFRRKHSDRRQWVCAKCSKAYAVQSDYKAHLKTCGTRGHSCDCGRVFSRVESFIEHQDACKLDCLSRTHTPTPNWHTTTTTTTTTATTLSMLLNPSHNPHRRDHNLELQLLPPSNAISTAAAPSSTTADDTRLANLHLAIGLGAGDHERAAVAEKAMADEARQKAKRQMELAEQEFANAKRVRHKAQAELSRALALRDHAVKQINEGLLQITCYACKQRFLARTAMAASDENSFAASYMSSAVTEGEVGNDDGYNQGRISTM
ncbi:protein indeterminate-domain 14-like [Typha angustifolia]|uniref:protein indeterminate-domain 14-like n=1 Tax=Typha angustifolia TaxID=59011 RepID=UPI003C2B350B